MIRVIPAIEITITCNSDPRLQQLFPLQSPLLIALDWAVGFNIAVNSSPCPCPGFGFSTDCSPLRVYLLQVEPYLQATVFPGVYLLWHRLIHSHSCFEVHLFQRDILHGPQCLQRHTCSSVALPTATAPSGVTLLQHGLIHGCSSSRGVPALLWAYCGHML